MKKLTKIVCGLLLATIAGSSFANANQEIAKNSIYTKIGVPTLKISESGDKAELDGIEFGIGYERRIDLNKNLTGYSGSANLSVKQSNQYYIGFKGELGFSKYSNVTVKSNYDGVNEEFTIPNGIKGSSGSLLVGFGTEANFTVKNDNDYTDVNRSKLEAGLYLGVKHLKLEAYNTKASASYTMLVFQPELSVRYGKYFKLGVNAEVGGKSGLLSLSVSSLVGISF